MTRRRRFSLPHLLMLVTIAGCGRADRIPTASIAPGSEPSALNLSAPGLQSRGLANFYPLDIGNRWHYAGFTHSKHGDVEKGGRWTRETTLARLEERSGRTYVREEITRNDDQQKVQFVRWLRQDRSGLFEGGVPPPRAPQDYETMLLAYPLHRGATWTVDEFRGVTATAEGTEVLDTPAGRFPSWRVRLRYAGGFPSEVFVWYGREGYLGMKRHDEYERLGSDGNPVKVTVDEAEWLEGISLSLPASR